MPSALQSLRAKIKKRLGTNTGSNNDDSPFSNPIAIAMVIIIALGFIIYGAYLYWNDTGRVRRAHTYYGHDIRTWSPLFTLDAEKIEPCIERCKLDPLCAGVTLDSDTLTCTGTKNSGVLRQDAARYSSWIKPKADYNVLAHGDPLQWRAIGIVDSRNRLSAETQLPGIASSGGHYNISMWVTLSDFYEGLGKWRHIMHLGTDPSLTSLSANSSQEWSSITAQLPDQLPGVWITPQSNNMRIAMTTIQRPDPGQSGSVEKKVEWVDIGNTPTPGKPAHISLNIYPEMVEVYVDGWLSQTMKLRGRPVMLAKQPDMFFRQMPVQGRLAGFAGRISDVLVVPRALYPGDIKKIVSGTRPY